MNKNSASRVYRCILLYCYLVLGIFLFDFQNSYFIEQNLVPDADDKINSCQNKKDFGLFVAGLVPFMLRLNKYLFNGCNLFQSPKE